MHTQPQPSRFFKGLMIALPIGILMWAGIILLIVHFA